MGKENGFTRRHSNPKRCPEGFIPPPEGWQTLGKSLSHGGVKKRKGLSKGPARAAHHVPWQPSAAPRHEDKGPLGEGLTDAQPVPFSLFGSFREKQGG